MSPGVDLRRRAAALGYSLLRSDWRADSLAVAVVEVLLPDGIPAAEQSATRAQVRRLVAEIQVHFPRPPQDRPGALLALLERSEPFALLPHPPFYLTWLTVGDSPSQVGTD